MEYEKNIHTLTAYQVRFVVRRGSDEDTKEKLKSIKEDDVNLGFSIEKLLNLFIENYRNNDLGSDLTHIIKIENPGTQTLLDNGFKRTFVSPDSGRKDIKTIMYDTSGADMNKRLFEENWVATHPKNIFFYEKDDKIYAVFHRVGGSGCKSIFKDYANELLKEDGISIALDLMLGKVPQEMNLRFVPESIILEKTESVKSSDLSDQISSKTKKRTKVVSKKLVFNLGYGLHNPISDAFINFKQGIHTKDEVYRIIDETMNADNEYDTLKVEFRIGNVKRIVSWDKIEDIIDGYDITEELKNGDGSFAERLTNCSDNYIFDVVKVNK